MEKLIELKEDLAVKAMLGQDTKKIEKEIKELKKSSKKS